MREKKEDKRTEILKKSHRVYDLVVTWLVSTDELEFWVLSIGTVAVGLREKVGADGEVSLTNAGVMRWRRNEAGKSILTRVFRPLFATCSGRYSVFPRFELFSPALDFLLACIATLFHLALNLLFSGVPYISSKVFYRRFSWSWQRESSGAARIVPSFSYGRSSSISCHYYSLSRLFLVVSRVFLFLLFFLAFGWQTDIARISAAIHFAPPSRIRSSLSSVYWEKRGNCYCELSLTTSFSLCAGKETYIFLFRIFFLSGFNDRTPFSCFNDYDFHEVPISIAQTIFGLRKVIVWVPGSICLVEFF